MRLCSGPRAAAGPGGSGCPSGSSRTGRTGIAPWSARRPKDGVVIVGREEDRAAVVAAVEGVIDQAVSDRAERSSHADRLSQTGRRGARKNELTPLIPARVPWPALRSASRRSGGAVRSGRCQPRIYSRLPNKDRLSSLVILARAVLRISWSVG